MIVYRELSSLTNDLGVSAEALFCASNYAYTHYHKKRLPKGNGEYRELSVPDGFLKDIQRRIAMRILAFEEISPYATAYRSGGSTIVNARPHLGGHILLKLDIRHFFDSIIYSQVREKVFPSHKYSDANSVLLTMICMYRDSLPQGAPTSPFISNIIMKDFDNRVGEWCRSRSIRYTRYCDDMSFSGDMDPRPVRDFVSSELRKMGFFLNHKKTVVARKGQRKLVTGIVVNDKLGISAAYRRKLRQEIYYCRRYGVASHLSYIKSPQSEGEYLSSVLGKVNYVLSVCATDKEMLSYRKWLEETLRSTT